MSNNLLERVARAIDDVFSDPDARPRGLHDFTSEARAAIRIVVEECASVVEENANRCYGLPYHLLMANAAAIRALLEDGND